MMSYRLILESKVERERTIWPVDDLQHLLRKTDDLASDVITSIRKGEEVKNPKLMPRCTFHQHGEDEPCYSVADKEKKQLQGYVGTV